MIEDVDETGQRIEGETLLILLNAHHEPIPFQLPAHDHVARWELVLDTARPPSPPGGEGGVRGRPNGESHPTGPRASEPRSFAADEKYNLRDRSLVVLRLGKPEQTRKKTTP